MTRTRVSEGGLQRVRWTRTITNPRGEGGKAQVLGGGCSPALGAPEETWEEKGRGCSTHASWTAPPAHPWSRRGLQVRLAEGLLPPRCPSSLPRPEDEPVRPADEPWSKVDGGGASPGLLLPTAQHQRHPPVHARAPDPSHGGGDQRGRQAQGGHPAGLRAARRDVHG